MDWEECLKARVRKRVPNPEEARALLRMAGERKQYMDAIKNRNRFTSLVVEDYYEIIKGLVAATMALEGYKSYSHECMVAFMEGFTGKITRPERELVDQLRRIRNDVSYRGFVLEPDYLQRNEDGILSIIDKLESIIKGRLDQA